MSSNKPSKLQLIVAFLSVYIFWGGTYLGMKFALDSFPPFLMAAIRHTIAGSILLVIGLMKKEARPTKDELVNAGIVGLLLLLMGNGLVAWSEQRLPSAIASLIITSTPFWIMLLNWVGGDKRKPTKIELFTLMLGFLGILLMVFQGPMGQSASLDMLGIFTLLVAAFVWALGSLFSRHRRMPKSSFFSTSAQMLAGGASLFILSFALQEPDRLDILHLTTRSLWAMGYLILFGSVVAYTAYIWLMKNVNPTLASTYAFINPVVAVILGYLLANEVLSLQTLIAAVIIVSAVVILTFSKQTKA